jgi:hypothetical protein
MYRAVVENAVTPTEAELLVDGTPRPASSEALVLAVGEHALLVRAPGYGELRRSLLVQGREDEELALRLHPLNPPPASVASEHRERIPLTQSKLASQAVHG